MTRSININELVKQWTGETSLDKLPVEKLSELVTENPYCASLQFLLAKKYQQIQSPLLAGQLKKVNIFFPSTLYLDYLLHLDLEEEENNQPIDLKLNNLVSSQLAQFNESVETAVLDFAQTKELQLQKDYFEAQGIQIDLSKIPQDKFTQQLRSFTAWLKVIKNKENDLNSEEIGEAQEKIIAAIAEKANIPEDIITESMAAIWEKQGNFKKAIDTYSKLSFIFPEKSVYFASRIEQLKQKK